MHHRRPSGLYVPAADLAQQSAPGKPVLEELAGIEGGRDITRGIVDSLPLLDPMDPLLGRDGGAFLLDTWLAVLDDWQVFAALEQRKNAVTGTEWEVLPGGPRRQDKAAAKLLEDVLAAIRWDAITGGMHRGIFFGHAVGEILWMRDGGHVVPEAIRVRDQRRFHYAPDGSLHLVTQWDSLRGEQMPPRKFWTFSTGAHHDDDPYGMGLAHWCYWPVQFKRGTNKLWLVALDKFASPTAMGTFPPNTSPADRARLLAALSGIRSQAALILPQGYEAELLASARSGGGDFKAADEYWDAAISKVILGHGSGMDATPGRLGAEDNAADVRADLVNADADLECASANLTWVRWMTEWSYPGAALPQVWRRTEEDQDLKERSEYEERVFAMGFRPTLKHVHEVYGGEWVEQPKAAAPAPTEPNGATADAPAAAAAAPADTDTDPTEATDMAQSCCGTDTPHTHTVSFADALQALALPGEAALAALDAAETPEALQAAMEPLIRPILARAEREPEALMGALAELYPQMDSTALQNLLADMLYYAELAGIVAAEDEARRQADA